MTTLSAPIWTKNDPRLTFDEATHTYRLGDQSLVSVTQALAQVGIADFSAPWFTEDVLARGTALHAAIALDVEGTLDESCIDDRLVGGVEGWRRFLRDTSAEIEWSEQPLCDPALGIAGRLDYILRLPNAGPKRLLVDVKRGLYPSAAIQTAAYAEMAAPLYDTTVLFTRAALVLPGDGSYKLHTFSDVTDRATWQACVRVINWRAQHGLISR